MASWIPAAAKGLMGIARRTRGPVLTISSVRQGSLAAQSISALKVNIIGVLYHEDIVLTSRY